MNITIWLFFNLLPIREYIYMYTCMYQFWSKLHINWRRNRLLAYKWNIIQWMLTLNFDTKTCKLSTIRSILSIIKLHIWSSILILVNPFTHTDDLSRPNTMDGTVHSMLKGLNFGPGELINMNMKTFQFAL